MEEAEGKIVLTGFSMEPAEKAIVDNLIKNYQHKIREKVRYKEVKLRLKKSTRGKAFWHEVQGSLITDKMFNAEAGDFNLFSAISEVLDKLMHEVEHTLRTKRQEK